MFSICSSVIPPSSPSGINCHCSSNSAFSSPGSDSALGSVSVGSLASSSVSYSASTGAAVLSSGSVTTTFTGAGWFLVLLLVTGGFGGVVFLGPATVARGVGLGLATLASLPTCALHGTFAGGGVTAGGAVGVDTTCAGGVVGTPPQLVLVAD